MRRRKTGVNQSVGQPLMLPREKERQKFQNMLTQYKYGPQFEKNGTGFNKFKFDQFSQDGAQPGGIGGTNAANDSIL